MAPSGDHADDKEMIRTLFMELIEISDDSSESSSDDDFDAEIALLLAAMRR